MILRRLSAPSVREALILARKECGPEALILKTSRTRRGAEILAARPQVPGRPKGASKRGIPAPAAGNATPATASTGRPDLAALKGRGIEAGLSSLVLATIERALSDMDLALSSPADPALPRVWSRIFAAMMPVRTLESLGRVLALVGPTGAGKTTTLAKLAARAAREKGQRVVLATLDLHRVAAVEQLRAYGDLLAVPVEVAFTPGDLRRILRSHQGADRIFLDTSGRSPRDGEALRRLAHTFTDLPVERVLCIPAGTRLKDLERIQAAYDCLAATSLAVTKWDETAAPGEVLSHAIETGTPLALVTDGQAVPEDLRPAVPERLALDLLGELAP